MTKKETLLKLAERNTEYANRMYNYDRPSEMASLEAIHESLSAILKALAELEKDDE